MNVKLVCPVDNVSLRYMSGGYECLNGHRWDVVDSIPRFVDKSHYSEAFGYQWNTWPKVQLDSYTGFPTSADRTKSTLGADLWNRLVRGGMNILEAGCGAGRFTEVLLSHPSVHVCSVDASNAVKANQKNFPQNKNHRIYQADILRLPFAPRQFDLVFCLGVVQHTKSPEETIHHLYNQVREGGALVFDHYSFRAGYFLHNPVKLFLRLFLKRMEPKNSMILTNKLVDIFFPLHRATKKIQFLQFVLSRISPIQTAYHYPELNDIIQYQWSQLDTYDALTDWYKHTRTKGQIESILAQTGAEHIEVFRGSRALVGRCYRPSIAE